MATEPARLVALVTHPRHVPSVDRERFGVRAPGRSADARATLLTLGSDAVLFVISALSLALVHRSLRSSEAPPPVSFVHEIAVGGRFVAHHKVVRAASAFSTVVSLVAAPVIPS